MWPTSSVAKAAAESAGTASRKARAKLTREIVMSATKAHLDDPKANSVAKLATKYGVTRMTMHRAIQRSYQWGQRAPNKKLTPSERKEFHKLAAGGMDQAALVQYFGIEESHAVELLGTDDRLERFAAKVAVEFERRRVRIDG